MHIDIIFFYTILFLGYIHADMQNVTAMRPLVAELFSDCGREKTGILLNLWKLSDKML